MNHAAIDGAGASPAHAGATGSAGTPTPGPPGAKLRLANVSKSFQRGRNATEVLRDISLDVAEAEFVSVVGASGCGKTTLLRIIDGLVPHDSGEILLNGQPITGPGPDRGFVFQSDCLLPWRTVGGNVAFGLELQGVRRAEARARARQFIELVGLASFEGHFPHELSGGMRQRVNLARALTVDPEVLLMDEPFAALDAQTRELMQRELLRIWTADRKTVLFVTHQIDEAVYLSDRVVVLTARPGRMGESIEIDLPRPRSLEIKRTPAFTGYVDRIWRRIEHEVENAMTT
jgi:NitT/TauT family transport system ATP-binding protein